MPEPGRWASSPGIMKSRRVTDGEMRLRESPEFQARLRELKESIRARHAEAFAKAGLVRRMFLRWQMAVEFRRERRKIEPSAHSLYSSHVTAEWIRL